jgi:hypothetical protein
MQGAPLPPGQVAYLGPATNINSETNYQDADPVGADKPGNHVVGDACNVLRKSGDVITVTTTEAYWSAVMAKCAP